MIRHRKTQKNTYLACQKWSNPPTSCAFFFCLARNLETWLSEVHPWTWVVDVAGNVCQTNGKTSKQGKPNSIAIPCHLESRRQGGLDWEFGNEFWAPNLLIPWHHLHKGCWKLTEDAVEADLHLLSKVELADENAASGGSLFFKSLEFRCELCMMNWNKSDAAVYWHWMLKCRVLETRWKLQNIGISWMTIGPSARRKRWVSRTLYSLQVDSTSPSDLTFSFCGKKAETAVLSGNDGLLGEHWPCVPGK